MRTSQVYSILFVAGATLTSATSVNAAPFGLQARAVDQIEERGITDHIKASWNGLIHGKPAAGAGDATTSDAGVAPVEKRGITDHIKASWDGLIHGKPAVGAGDAMTSDAGVAPVEKRGLGEHLEAAKDGLLHGSQKPGEGPPPQTGAGEESGGSENNSGAAGGSGGGEGGAGAGAPGKEKEEKGGEGKEADSKQPIGKEPAGKEQEAHGSSSTTSASQTSTGTSASASHSATGTVTPAGHARRSIVYIAERDVEERDIDERDLNERDVATWIHDKAVAAKDWTKKQGSELAHGSAGSSGSSDTTADGTLAARDIEERDGATWIHDHAVAAKDWAKKQGSELAHGSAGGATDTTSDPSLAARDVEERDIDARYLSAQDFEKRDGATWIHDHAVAAKDWAKKQGSELAHGSAGGSTDTTSDPSLAARELDERDEHAISAKHLVRDESAVTARGEEGKGYTGPVIVDKDGKVDWSTVPKNKNGAQAACC